MKSSFWIGLSLGLGLGISAAADLRPDMVHVADGKKTQAYIRDGLYVGGDKAVDGVIVKDIRRAKNAKFERIVLDLEGNRNGEGVAIQRPPYFQIAVTPDEKRITLTVWGHVKLGFDPKKVLAEFKKSAVFKSVDLLPPVEENSWTFAFELKSGRPVEVFELADPVRIILDVQTRHKAG